MVSQPESLLRKTHESLASRQFGERAVVRCATVKSKDARPAKSSERHPTSFGLVPTGAKQSTPRALYDRVWSRVLSQIQKRATSSASRQITVDFLYGAHEDFLSIASDDAIRFVARSLGGCDMAAPTTEHWAALCFALLGSSVEKTLASAGYRLAEPLPDPLQMVERGPRYPLVQIRGQYYCVTQNERGEIEIFTDSMPEAVTFDQLDVFERTLVEVVATTGECQCELCIDVRTSRKVKMPEILAGRFYPFNPKIKRVFLFHLKDLPAGYPTTKNKRIAKCPFYLLDSSFEDGLELPNEPSFADDEDVLKELVSPLSQAFEDSAVGIRHVADTSGGKSRVSLGWHNSASLDELRQSFVEQGFEIVPHDYLLVRCIATPSIILNEYFAARSPTDARASSKKKAPAKTSSKKKVKRA